MKSKRRLCEKRSALVILSVIEAHLQEKQTIALLLELAAANKSSFDHVYYHYPSHC